MRISTALALASACLLAAVAPALSDPEWKKQTFAADGFEAAFPGPVEASQDDLGLAVRMLAERSTNYSSSDETRLFVVSAMLMRIGVSEVEDWARTTMETLECKVRSRSVELKVSGVRAHEIAAEQCTMDRRLLVRVVARGRWLYQAIGFVGAEADMAMAETFVGSLTLLPE
jgi:hypothetical protein